MAIEQEMKELCKECGVDFFKLHNRIAVRADKGTDQLIQLSNGELKVLLNSLQIAAGI